MIPFDTCDVIEERWANWLRQDPVVAIETQADNLRKLKALYIDCGEKDQFNLLYGARRFVGPHSIKETGERALRTVKAGSHPPRSDTPSSPVKARLRRHPSLRDLAGRPLRESIFRDNGQLGSRGTQDDQICS